jgi:hypothetical protein
MGQSQEIFLRLINAESGNQPLLGRALVARAILNRHWLIAQGVVPPSKFNSKSADILDIVSAPRQFQPYDEGKLNQPLSAEQRNKAMLAVSLALDADKLKKVIINDLQVDETEANKMLAVTGFSTHDAIPDSSQTANTFGLTGHKFTTAGNDNTLVLNSKGVIRTPESRNAMPENVLSTSSNRESMAVNEQKVIDDLNKLAPVLDVKLNAQGETVRERYLKKVYGEENVSVDEETKEFYVKGGGNSLVPAPKPTFVGQLGAMSGDVVAGAVGEGIGGALGGSRFGPIGAAGGAILGAGAGAAVGTGANFTKATVAAAAQGLVKPEELKEIAKSGGFASATSGVLGSVFGRLGQALKPSAQSLKISGNTGLGIGKMKGEIEQQVMSDDLLKQIDPAVQAEQASTEGLDYFGQAVKTGIGGLIDRIDRVGNQLFDTIDGRVKQGIETGKVQFADVSDIYNNLVTNLGKLDGKEIPTGTAPQIVERLQNALGGTTGTFNPKAVTAGDFRSAINTISSLYDEGINTFASKPLAQFRTDLTNKALEAGGNFAKYKKAFEVFKMKYDLIPDELQGIKSLDTTTAGKVIKGLTKDKNAKVGKLVENYFDPATAQQFKTGLMKDTIYRTSVLKSSLRKVPKEVPAEVQAQLPSKTFAEGKEAVDQGLNLQMKGVKQTLKEGRQQARSVNEPFVSGKGLGDFFLSQEGDNISPLLKGTPIDPKLANKLESAQKAAGLVTRVPDSANFNNEAVSAAAPVVEKVIRKSNIGSIALDALGGIINPIQRGLGAAGEAAAPVFGSGILPSIVRPAAGNLIGSLAGINPATNFSNTALTEEQQKRLIGGVRNGQR